MRYKSFDQFISEMDRSEEIEKEVVNLGTPEEHDEDEAEKVQANESEEKPAEAEKAEVVEKAVSEMVTKEAKAWESDAHDEHTIESYMCENAALVAGLAAKSLKECKEEFGLEAYEAALNMISEAFDKKIQEVKLAESGQSPESSDEPEAGE
jgi:hypothetical protein